MNEKLDPKELKILSDILALVLEEQSGQSASALETLKKRAKKNAITGGALKNLFSSIVNSPPTKQPRQSKTQKTNDLAELIKARSQINDLTQSINRLDATVRGLRRSNESLRSELTLTQRSRAELQSALYCAESKSPYRTILITVSFICGLFVGIAGTMVVHTLNPSPNLPNNTIYLR
ncbi:hypothetical protein COMNV_00212 [Commensalibacter sp. Nvir]|uniref:hypothetical protein n=1 Tax=Commensalibacter sp. Nvir TaxID=3069817 RepID=UPI002D748384|nr:hypothetical protein COMNV_00212 [Commensalibacter sp. Nvir]